MFKITAITALFAFSAFSDTVIGGGKVLSATGVQLDSDTFVGTIDTHFVQRIAIRVIPGYCSKIYISIGGAPNKTSGLQVQRQVTNEQLLLAVWQYN